MIAPELPTPTSPFASIKHRISTMLSYGLVSKVVVLSQTLGRTYQKLWHLRQDQLEVISNGVDLQRFAPSANIDERARLRQRLDIPTEAKVVLFVGGVMPRKGVDLLLRAWNAVSDRDPEALLLIVGSNGPRDSHQLGALSAELRGYFDTLRALREN
jgi:glycosyltransferase involved in cell wall biosynthesis